MIGRFLIAVIMAVLIGLICLGKIDSVKDKEVNGSLSDSLAVAKYENDSILQMYYDGSMVNLIIRSNMCNRDAKKLIKDSVYMELANKY